MNDPNSSDPIVKSRTGAQFREIWRRFKKSRTAIFGLVLLLVFVIISITADMIVPYEMTKVQDYDALLKGVSRTHPFGTDHIGRDIFARVIHGTRNSLFIGVGTSVVALVFGGILGAIAGYYGGRVDDWIMRILDAFMCIPAILLALAIVAALGANMLNLMIAITIAITPSVTRLVRSVILTIVGQDFVEAAHAYGCRDSRIIFKYILPNAMGTIIVNTTMNIASMILSAAGLSFVGMGIQPPAPEWGSMLSEAKVYMRLAPHFAIFPGIAILLSALSFNLVGDGLRDALDPRLKD